MKHTIFAQIDTRTAEGRTGTLYINQDQWSGWIFNGDGTATADVYATLWGLAELVTGDGKNWNKIEGYNGDPGKMPIGQTVDYSKLTRIIPTKILIIKGTVHENKKDDIKKQIKKAVQVLNPQQVAVLFDYSIDVIEPKTTGRVELLNIEIGVDSTPDDKSYNEELMKKIGNGIISKDGEIIPLFDPDEKIFTQIYTDKIKNHTHTPNTKVLDGFAFYEIPTMILTESAYTLDTTIAHEICHNFGLNDIADPNQINNLMYNNNNRTGYNLELDEVNLIKKKLEKYSELYISR
ncbi:hypothetical protein FACS1894130_09250 [Spirochaetia bacterium]|nr:hypothetical protein FACS1894130_09250 [Spirochaetia bacterium]